MFFWADSTFMSKKIFTSTCTTNVQYNFLTEDTEILKQYKQSSSQMQMEYIHHHANSQ